jgi:hypothetical protein
MGLKADIEEVTNIWHQAPWRVKLFLGLSFFLSTSSIASLSETIFKWQGFVLDALNFYRKFISQPASEAVQKLLDHPLPSEALDCSVMLTMFFAGMARVAIFRPKSKAAKVVDLATFLACYLVMIYLFFNPTKHDQTTPANPNSVWIIYPAFLVWFYLFLKGAERILAISYMLAPVVAVAVLGAVSSGLSH